MPLSETELGNRDYLLDPHCFFGSTSVERLANLTAFLGRHMGQQSMSRILGPLIKGMSEARVCTDRLVSLDNFNIPKLLIEGDDGRKGFRIRKPKIGVDYLYSSKDSFKLEWRRLAGFEQDLKDICWHYTDGQLQRPIHDVVFFKYGKLAVENISQSDVWHSSLYSEIVATYLKVCDEVLATLRASLDVTLGYEPKVTYADDRVIDVVLKKVELTDISAASDHEILNERSLQPFVKTTDIPAPRRPAWLKG